jgi:hypothetical protein
VRQHKKASKQAGPSSIVNETFKSQESKGKTKLVEEASTVALEEKGHKTKTVRKGSIAQKIKVNIL